ncbi:hypothetical protein KSS87_019908, partial [Heliosperma pusillum]
ELIQELKGSIVDKIVRDEDDLIGLPRQLWCSLKKDADGETYAGVGWLLDRDFAISSTCILSSDYQVKTEFDGVDDGGWLFDVDKTPIMFLIWEFGGFSGTMDSAKRDDIHHFHDFILNPLLNPPFIKTLDY